MNILYYIAGERIENGDVVCLNTETGLLFKAIKEDVKYINPQCTGEEVILRLGSV